MSASDRAAVGCIALIAAVPLVAGGGLATFLALRPRPPAPIAEPAPPPAPPPPPPVTAAAVVTAPPAPTVETPVERAVPVAPERRVQVVWDAKVVRAQASRIVPGTRCEIEVTIGASGSTLRLASGMTVRCGGLRVYQQDGAVVGDEASVREVPGPDPGTAAYAVNAAEDRLVVDSAHARASVVPEASPDGLVSLVVAQESRPVAGRLLASTPPQPAFHAGPRPSPGDDDETTGRVVAATGDTVVEPGARCRVGFHYYGVVDGNDRCHALIVCGAATLIGRPERFAGTCRRDGRRVLSMKDLEPASADGDPALDFDGPRARVWNDAEGSRWSVSIALDPRR